ncbi:3-oxoacid CoA-transferase subunit A [Tissierella carlieri]|mgnify:CR=1 FL=1|jgi:acetate CoA/acetoacetate CoA-transferase alpha subunit|uniref:CoA transferase subunit A n=1 Tax=Tissierella TaxID=41273 RepID=UPI000B9FE262|nr:MULTISPECIES: 3-oxoacid CoA-transferase subunit A [Tissierella]MBU5310712.1 3-oxoacid CoA-transferase subunit A [Tissierella carlieri]MDU5079805.1 3-oxoacid CoA-transferase subunit A [Bacillota bacterium]OZV13406.1 branched-chain amino acid dehydrogenase [Tissierella sp. P1]
MNKVISIDAAIDHIKDGMTIMIGGFLGCGSPHRLIDALVKKGVKDLTLICNDSGFPEIGAGKLVVNKQIKKLIASHVGTNRETGNQMNSGEMEVVLVPQGTLAEQVRAGGAGLGGFLTPTGVGTIVEEGKEKMIIDGKTYLLEKPLRADVALIAGATVDKFGNIVYHGATRNFNTLMATAADTVIVEAEKVLEIGELDPNDVVTSGIFVDYIVNGGDK